MNSNFGAKKSSIFFNKRKNPLICSDNHHLLNKQSISPHHHQLTIKHIFYLYIRFSDLACYMWMYVCYLFMKRQKKICKTNTRFIYHINSPLDYNEKVSKCLWTVKFQCHTLHKRDFYLFFIFFVPSYVWGIPHRHFKNLYHSVLPQKYFEYSYYKILYTPPLQDSFQLCRIIITFMLKFVFEFYSRL